MNECYHNSFVADGKVQLKTDFLLPLKFSSCVYEVLRIVDGIPLFIEEHQKRLDDSLEKLQLVSKFSISNFLNDILLLIHDNNCVDGNVKYDIYFIGENVHRFAYYLKHSYPTPEMYNSGVVLESLFVERPEPNAKQVHISVKMKVDELLATGRMYEIVLVNSDGAITEGSRSNLFFVKNNTLYTAPDVSVLKGITRKFVIHAIERLNYKLNYEMIHIRDIHQFDAAFMCGTSPKVLAVSKIDKTKFNTSNEAVNTIAKEYDKIISEYIFKHK
jgi:branched-chain amino acid aminotransferase